MPRHAAVSLLVSALLTGAAAAQSSKPDELTPERWPELQRAARAVPGFAGLAFVWADGGRYLVPALKDPSQEDRARTFLRTDTFWKALSNAGGGVLRGYQPVKFDGVQLVQAAQVMKKRAPNLTVRINTSLNRVLVSATYKGFLPFARAAGVADLIEPANEYERLPPVKFDVQPRTLSLRALRTSRPKGGLLPGLNVRITNPTGMPLVFHPKCGGVILTATRADGTALPEMAQGMGALCADLLESVVIQPGQTMTLPANVHVDLTKLTPGKYLWTIGKHTIPFTLTP